MKKDPTAFRERFKAWKEGKDPYRYLYDDQSGKWNRITDDENADAFANFVATPNGSRPTSSMYENTPNPTLPVSKNESVVPDNTLWTRQLVEKANNTRTWRSDAADAAHALGEGVLLSTMFIDPAIEPLVYPTYQIAKLVATNAIKNEFAPTIISSMMKPSVNKMPSVINRFRNQEWSNFLSTTNGDNYYRIARNAKMLNPDEKYFFSHTTPWEEFSGGGSEFPSGAARLYEFPTKTFGKLNATTHTGLETPESVVDMGIKHLLYGNTSSGPRGPVRVLNDKAAELLEMDPFINGILERPRYPNGFYDKNPNYENIYLGNQTTIDGNTVNQALRDATHTVYYPTQGGVQKELYLAPEKTSTRGIQKTIHKNK